MTRLLALLTLAATFLAAQGYCFLHRNFALARTDRHSPKSALLMTDDFLEETHNDTRERIQELVDSHPILLFMKGSKLFPQCGFSNTAVQILQAYDVDFHTVDVLSNDAIRQGVKDFSQWPTIPQLYVAGDFIGGSDIMIELYQTGELGEMIEKARADAL